VARVLRLAPQPMEATPQFMFSGRTELLPAILRLGFAIMTHRPCMRLASSASLIRLLWCVVYKLCASYAVLLYLISHSTVLFSPRNNLYNIAVYLMLSLCACVHRTRCLRGLDGYLPLF